MSEIKKILGIDPGYGRLGYAVLARNSQSFAIEKMGCLETDSKMPFPERLYAVGAVISSLIKEHSPEALSIEKIFFAKNQKTSLSVAEARGAIIYVAAEHKLSILEFTPMEVKMAVCGYGHADKKQVQYMLKTMLKIDEMPRRDDTADAVAIALAGLTLGRIAQLNKAVK